MGLDDKYKLLQEMLNPSLRTTQGVDCRCMGFQEPRSQLELRTVLRRPPPLRRLGGPRCDPDVIPAAFRCYADLGITSIPGKDFGDEPFDARTPPAAWAEDAGEGSGKGRNRPRGGTLQLEGGGEAPSGGGKRGVAR